MGRGSLLMLDGGMGHVLRARLGTEDPSKSHEEECLRIHLDFLRSGSDVVTTNSFFDTPALPSSNEREGNVEERKEEIGRRMKEAGRMAKKAKDIWESNPSNRRVLVAASLPPTHSCYVPPEDPSEKKFAVWYYEVAVNALLPYADFFLCETMPTSWQGIVAAKQACATGKPVYVSWTLEDLPEGIDPILRGGERLEDAVRSTLHAIPSLKGILVNCCAPESITAAMPVLSRFAKEKGLHFGGYGNAFWHTTTSWVVKEGYGGDRSGICRNPLVKDRCLNRQRDDFDQEGIMLPEVYREFGRVWVDDFGADMLGGCCGTSMDHIRALKELVEGASSTKPER